MIEKENRRETVFLSTTRSALLLMIRPSFGKTKIKDAKKKITLDFKKSMHLKKRTSYPIIYFAMIFFTKLLIFQDFYCKK